MQASDTNDIEAILRKFESRGFVEEKRGEWLAIKKSVHLRENHFMTVPNHAKWRCKNLEPLENNPSAGLCYSSIYSLSRVDLDRLKELVARFV